MALAAPVSPTLLCRLRQVAATLGLLAAAGTLALGGLWLSAPERFPLEVVRLDGRLVRVEEAELRQAILPYLDRGLLALDVAGVREAVEQLPWVATATVRRHWPDTLVIGVVERVAVAHWNKGLIDEQGELFHPPAETVPAGLPVLEGPADSARLVWQRFRRLQAILAEAGLELAALRLDERRAWSAVLRDGATMQLGVDADDAAAERFARALPRIKAPANAQLARVDLRYPNGFALAWTGAAPQGSGNRQ